MEAIRVGGRKYADPDVLSLVRATGALIDPRFSVLNQARELIGRMRSYDGVPTDALQRLSIMASMLGIRIVPMNLDEQRGERRDAVLMTSICGERTIVYNPQRMKGRVAFSIAHEICHTFFPSSVSGARFRSICRSDSREANELERLCDLGASELLMPVDEFRQAAAPTYSLSAVEGLSARFGSSFEATVFRLASAHPSVAISGSLRYRLKVCEERQKNAAVQQQLFRPGSGNGHQYQRKYRRQSLHLSDACGDTYIVRWNKSFDQRSVVYKARLTNEILAGYEPLPNGVSKTGRLEAVKAPYQREDTDPEFPDILFFWSEAT